MLGTKIFCIIEMRFKCNLKVLKVYNIKIELEALMSNHDLFLIYISKVFQLEEMTK